MICEMLSISISKGFIFFFFFSSRRRHTRFDCDWSSDVCSSDLEEQRRARATGRPYEPPLEHPLLKEALAETLGVILYQDQVLQVCQALAGFTAGQAEALRRAMSRRRSRELMAGVWEEVRDGAAARGGPGRSAERGFKPVSACSEVGV